MATSPATKKVEEVSPVVCSGCGAKVRVVGKTTMHYVPLNTKSKDAATKYLIPFKCSLCGSIRMPYQAVRAVVFLWIPKLPKDEKIGSILIPDFEGRQGNTRDLLRAPHGVVLGFGPGAYTPEGKWMPSESLEVGDLVVYSKSVPWTLDVPGPDDKDHKIVMCSYADVIGIVDPRCLKES